MQQDTLTIKEASIFASERFCRNITTSNISYLIQYGRVKKINDGVQIVISKDDLLNYFTTIYSNKKQNHWQSKLGDDLNWSLSFDKCKESETTKHVHRLHPYKGKFIPQLVEYFLDSKTDAFKQDVYFKKGDLVLDPFCGSGTTLVQSAELGIHSIGVDISSFNSLISNAKIDHYDLNLLKSEIDKITRELENFVAKKQINDFELALSAELSTFNTKHFPSPEYKYKLHNKELDEKRYGSAKELEFLSIYHQLVDRYQIILKQDNQQSFLDKWYLVGIREEINLVFELIKNIEDKKTKKIISIILSRTIRSYRATTHADLATLKEPITQTYYCSKHGKICKPLFSISAWWKRYADDTIKRLKIFASLRRFESKQICLVGDSRNIDIISELEKKHHPLAQVIQKQKIKGIFSSPPYVGLIDYHEQHAYSYELFGFERNDDNEIGPMFRGQGKVAKDLYVQGISDVLNNSKRFLVEDYDIFLVANDKHNLYDTIAKNAGMQIVKQYKRPVINRTEKDKGAYCEVIFHLKSL